MPNPVAVDHVVARWRPLTAQEETNAFAFLEDAWAELLAYRPTLEADMVAGTVLEQNVIRVVSRMVIRVLQNPELLTSESIGSYSYSRDVHMYLTDEDLALITPVSGRAKTRSVRLVAYGE